MFILLTKSFSFPFFIFLCVPFPGITVSISVIESAWTAAMIDLFLSSFGLDGAVVILLVNLTRLSHSHSLFSSQSVRVWRHDGRERRREKGGPLSKAGLVVTDSFWNLSKRAVRCVMRACHHLPHWDMTGPSQFIHSHALTSTSTTNYYRGASAAASRCRLRLRPCLTIFIR